MDVLPLFFAGNRALGHRAPAPAPLPQPEWARRPPRREAPPPPPAAPPPPSCLDLWARSCPNIDFVPGAPSDAGDADALDMHISRVQSCLARWNALSGLRLNLGTFVPLWHLWHANSVVYMRFLWAYGRTEPYETDALHPEIALVVPRGAPPPAPRHAEDDWPDEATSSPPRRVFTSGVSDVTPESLLPTGELPVFAMVVSGGDALTANKKGDVTEVSCQGLEYLLPLGTVRFWQGAEPFPMPTTNKRTIGDEDYADGEAYERSVKRAIRLSQIEFPIEAAPASAR